MKVFYFFIIILPEAQTFSSLVDIRSDSNGLRLGLILVYSFIDMLRGHITSRTFDPLLQNNQRIVIVSSTKE